MKNAIAVGIFQGKMLLAVAFFNQKLLVRLLGHAKPAVEG